MKLLKLSILLFTLLCFQSCLKNLNVTEFFRKLEIKSPQVYTHIEADRAAFEADLKKVIQNKYIKHSKIEEIYFWGEHRYACGNVVSYYDDKIILIPVWLKTEEDEIEYFTIKWDVTEDLEMNKKNVNISYY